MEKEEVVKELVDLYGYPKAKAIEIVNSHYTKDNSYSELCELLVIKKLIPMSLKVKDV